MDSRTHTKKEILRNSNLLILNSFPGLNINNKKLIALKTTFKAGPHLNSLIVLKFPDITLNSWIISLILFNSHYRSNNKNLNIYLDKVGYNLVFFARFDLLNSVSSPSLSSTFIFKFSSVVCAFLASQGGKDLSDDWHGFLGTFDSVAL